VPAIDGFVYDPARGGGTTTLEVDRDGKRVGQYVSLAGTLNNCAGGKTPWDTWLSCEEAEALGPIPHGYVFEVDPFNQDANRDPKPIKAFGRYAHESVVVEPGGGNRVYLTEDAGNPNGLLFRWTPPKGLSKLGPRVLRELPDDAGKLEAMKAFTPGGTHVPDLSVATEPGTTYKVQWVGVPDRDARTTSVRKQFTNTQITRSRKLEGMIWPAHPTAAPTSPRPSRASPTAAPRSTTGRSGSSTPTGTRSNCGCSSPTRRPIRTTTRTAPTTSRSRPTAA
jgi:secreted PhoX family phosphatase